MQELIQDLLTVKTALTRLRQAAVHPCLLPEDHIAAVFQRKLSSGAAKTNEIPEKVVAFGKDEFGSGGDKDTEVTVLDPEKTKDENTSPPSASPSPRPIESLQMLAAKAVVKARIPVKLFSGKKAPKAKSKVKYVTENIFDIIEKAKTDLPEIYPTKVGRPIVLG